MSKRHVDLVERFNGWQPDPTQLALLVRDLEADLTHWKRIARDRLRTLKAERKAAEEKLQAERNKWRIVAQAGNPLDAAYAGAQCTMADLKAERKARGGP